MPRKRIVIEGVVQGVGFRPFVYRTARAHGLAGWVLNDSRGVHIEAEGEASPINAFLDSLHSDLPPLAVVTRFDATDIPSAGEEEFVIRQSSGGGERGAQISPDTHVCPDCLEELFDPADRRFRYPFINCTNCGPRYTIVTGIPYDRPKTTMAAFPMCPACRAEYEDPGSRRFHAQPVACPDCGPRLALHDGRGKVVETCDPLRAAAELLRAGQIVAVKGLGGYHLAADAGNDGAVRELRRRKVRDEKPFALMAKDAGAVARLAEAGETELLLLTGVERPIVLLRQKEGHPLSAAIAPRNRYFGVMLPYTPLHHLLLEECFAALVMTSGNRSDEPIAFRDGDAAEKLSGIADAYLTHDREIHIRTDDSIARVMAGRPLLLRRARGYVPRGVTLPRPQRRVLALGAELKNTVCLSREDRAFLSQHVGDLQNPEVHRSFAKTVDHLRSILEIEPEVVAHDLHPDYHSTRYAAALGDMPRVAVQHHHAHLASCLAENGVAGEAIGVIFDGLGYGADGHIWGGEFLIGGFSGYRRAGHFAYVPMPGGDAATREPLRMAISYLIHAFGEDLPDLPLLERVPERDLALYRQMIARGVNSPLTSSCGRLFDAVAALVGLRDKVSYEGQAALELEMAIEGEGERASYPFEIEVKGESLILDPGSLVRAVVADVRDGVGVGTMSARFHNTLALMVREVCLRIREGTGLDCVALSGGVFQNCVLTEKVVPLLENEGFRVFTHSLVPPNDGGLALGQAAVAGECVD
ncbi:carbamoyltransferase HypF [uncultured Desulfuromonas sp.]|uniref:carbamoyltransferase HypF n=1 Tax=uncultured Desulfuromonas sp. TaxID=181013 RepID=UPI00262366AB|nr:carbamoyltransferase HypF [uncultured Desulfuromonas sp.]